MPQHKRMCLALGMKERYGLPELPDEFLSYRNTVGAGYILIDIDEFLGRNTMGQSDIGTLIP